ncbi:2-hydroxychromene-2-carboxylate isomerase [Bradyrhizobium sp. CCBAU 53338]|uniref:2-hydroxychromene-2-carboxylate isomerase n=1 Tax=Bradyrhizobium sp. CCBAU 53338 TaxID=1325111 RepID=UPI00188D2FB3|nr:2-hydroxychromene-2-carboxylate isomerase [Bradyrhizobium sp. CCBAU 53338]QOZ56060.1 2-hydroxychromene-2-carboxylate isomerase [Bradyrhizobium sp. CCBAU 53338]
MPVVDFYFDFRSPYSYLANSQVTAIPNIEITYRPMDVAAVMRQVGNTPTTIVCAAKGKYAGVDLQRWAAHYGIALKRQKDPKAIDGRRLLRAAIKALEGGDGSRAIHAIFNAMWVTGAPLVTPDDVAAVLTAAGMNAASMAASLDDEDLDKQLTESSSLAGDLGVFGAPTFIIGGEMFFGNDRLDFLRKHLEKLQ